MKNALILATTLLSAQIYSLEYEQQIDNNQVNVSRVKIFPKEEIGLHRDTNTQVVIALQGGTITRLESDDRKVEVQFPTGVPVFRAPDPGGEMHKSVNSSDKPIELIIIQLKNN